MVVVMLLMPYTFKMIPRCQTFYFHVLFVACVDAGEFPNDDFPLGG
jgi:hypothetical protein